MPTIITTPPGSGLDHCLEGFRTSLRKNPFNTRLIVPTAGLARSITRRVNEELPAFRKNAVTTPARFAEEIVRERAPGLMVIDEMLERQILLDLLGASDTGASFSHSGVNAGRVAELHTLFAEITAYQNEDSFFAQSDNEKIAGLSHLFHQYRTILTRENLIDGPSIYRYAATVRPENGLRLFVYGIRDPYPDLKGFLRHLAEHAASFTYYHPYTENPKLCNDRAEWLATQEITPIPARPGHAPFLNLFSGSEPHDPAAPKVFLHEFGSEKEEVEAIAQEIVHLLREGCDLREIAIGAPDLASATALIDDVFPDCGLPFTSTATTPLSHSPAVQAFVHLLDVPVSGYRREDVVEACASPHLGLLRGNPRITPAIVDRIARDAFIIDGYSSWTTSLARLRTRRLSEAGSPETPGYRRRGLDGEVDLVDAASASLQPILFRLRALEQTTVVQGHIRNVRDALANLDIPLADIADRVQEREDLRQLSQVLGEMEVNASIYAGHEIPYADFVRILKGEVQRKRVQRYRTGQGIRVIGLREVHDQEIPVLFLMALTDGQLPSVPGLLPFLSDTEEQALIPDKRKARLSDERFYFVSALCSATDRLYLTCTNAPQNGGLIPSPFLREVQEKIPHEEWTPRPPESSRRYLQRYAGRCLGGNRLPDPGILRAMADGDRIDDIVHRINVEYFHRDGDYDSPFDGVFSGDTAIRASLAKRFGESKAYSVSALEKYANCPFSFYLRYVLGLEALQDVEITLSPADRGSLVHSILARFYTLWIAEREDPPGPEDREDALGFLHSIAGEALADYGKDGPAWDAFRADLLGTGGYHQGILERFLDTEIARAHSPLRPARFESSFGFSGIENSLSPDPVTIPVRGQEGASFRIHGFIDRIDLTDEGAFTITDYKTGGHPGLPEIVKGTSLQLPLYIRACEIVTGGRGVAGAYFTLNRKEVRHRAELHDATHPLVEGAFGSRSRMGERIFAETIEQSISAAWTSIQAIRSGIFHPPATSCDSAEYCDYNRICRFSAFRVLDLAESEGGEE